MPVKYSVVVPAFKECGNIEALSKRVFAALDTHGFSEKEVEILIVDDNSRDGSVEVVERLARSGHNIRIIVRATERGLSSAVIHGIQHSTGEFVIVMDADLQHPPESVWELFRALEAPGVEFVCGTRYGKSSRVDKGWPAYRRLISWGARLLARPLTPLSDPMSGFFGLRRAVFNRGMRTVSPIGYKIALELFVKCRVRKFTEVPFSFGTRLVGESKLTGKVIVSYLLHLRALYWFEYSLLIVICCALALVAGLVGTRMLLSL
eukprot:gene5009-3604_t